MAPKHFEFGPFRLEPAEHLLMRGEEPVQLPPKAFETLLLLVESSGHVLQKNELMEALWPDSFVEESNLTQNIFLLRKALGEDRGDQHYIKTVPRVGYRFIAPVRRVLDESDAVVLESHIRERTVVREEIVEHEEETLDANVTDRRSEKKETGNSVFFMASSRFRVAALILGASALLIGSAVAFSHFRSSKMAAAAMGKETRAAAKQSEHDAAYEAYVNGRALWNKRTAGALFASISQFEQAIEKDPNFALAYDGLADAYAFDRVRWRDSEALAKKALDIDKRLAEPHATLGFIRTFWEWDWKDGEREFKQAIELNPNYATAHQWYAIHLAINSHLVEAEVEMRRAVQLEPNSAVMNADMGQILYFNRKYNEAIAACTKSLQLDPDFFNAHQYLYEIYTEKGLYDEAIEEVVKLSETSGAATFGFAKGAQKAYQTKGIRGFWQWRLQEMRTAVGSDYEVAEIHARLGEKDKALSDLERSWHDHEFNLIFLYANPTFLPLHRDERFSEIMHRMWPPSP
jgi:DNA-binding winged helix-turn-helix (wHTH) protein/Tfp pilus assembly protein PilF